MPHDAGHGRGRPPDGPPVDLKSLFGWPPIQAGPALPPLTASGLRAQLDDGPKVGADWRLPVVSSGRFEPNDVYKIESDLVPS